ncbi:MAG: hypothetical protein UX09_C0015G0013 [Candidatus Uhrbacteria bacterium GW2011_GWE2_45_35]|uniref:DUF8128 domain-containing protein n=2 Tax=Candidatus Uhriibacteriota TaxID=1752732 RepID=A0A0G1LPK0_9BACT|nr:MAG: hypothetical protein UW63_C0022G0008 [Candidatus Uhrbacteria bacterium GW2011_GWF2_44_350]KKU08626.1 MAG: hypothetical protein UX09_C0015G0013 [Candidatus Uhrbacteria bacterium GW2011_GWE2_45_35]HBR80911.1 hypothetical protein [Candidatus Uhrbacteria bacterium]HCU31227.1 hypothetical protein [Candidatus Uhrbacteria bacterium]
MFLTVITVDWSVPQMYLHAFLSQRIDVALLEVVLLVGWIPIAAIILEGFMEIWKDYRQSIYDGRLQYSLLAIDVPKMTEQSPKAIENIFSALEGANSNLLWKEIWFDGKQQPRFSIEIASVGGYIQYYFRCQTRFRDMVEASIYAQYPDAQIAEVEDYAKIVPSRFPDPEWDMWGTEFKLKKDNHVPFRTWPSFEHSMSQELKDPLANMLEQMSRMRPGECFFFQIVFSPTKLSWKEEGTKFINKVYGVDAKAKSGNGALSALLSWPGGFVNELTGVDINAMFGLSTEEKPKTDDIWRAFKITLAEKAQVEAVANKISKIGFETKVRILYFGKKGVFNKSTRASMVKGFLLSFNSPGLNEFGMYGPQIPKGDYFWQKWTYRHRQTRVTQAYKNRSFTLGATPRVMCVEELASLWHFPTITIKAPLIKKTESRRAEPPVSLPVASEETPLYRATPPTPSKKEAPPATLPGIEEEAVEDKSLFEPAVSFDSDIEFAPTIKNPIIQEKPTPRPVVSAVVKKEMPEALRILMEPGVELEDVSVPPVEE